MRMRWVSAESQGVVVSVVSEGNNTFIIGSTKVHPRYCEQHPDSRMHVRKTHQPKTVWICPTCELETER